MRAATSAQAIECNEAIAHPQRSVHQAKRWQTHETEHQRDQHEVGKGVGDCHRACSCDEVDAKGPLSEVWHLCVGPHKRVRQRTDSASGARYRCRFAITATWEKSMRARSRSAPTVAVTALLSAILALSSHAAAAAETAQWPQWDRFVDRFVQADGRVIDLTFDGKSTSEGQSYALFFALVANRRTQFDTLLAWTSDNLADGELGERLPGWVWGQHEDGHWGIKDRNAAADADLWLAYTLLEAGRLWQTPRYTVLGRQLLALVREFEVAHAGAAGPVLLPGPVGFTLSDSRFRINPSYLPGFMFRYFAAVDPQGPWAQIWGGYARMAPTIYAGGVAPDLFVVSSKGVITPDTERAPAGSYDAIRVYLWAGMSGENSEAIVHLLAPYAELIRTLGAPPEKVDPVTGAPVKADYSPIGYTGAVLPFLAALHEDNLLRTQRARLVLDAARALAGGATNYYDQVLILFGQGWHDGHYKFDERGRLEPRWRL
jgi:endoglucanase